MLYWGIDKLINVAHGMTVAQKFYGGVSVAAPLMKAFGGAEILLGVALVLGRFERVAFPALLAVTGFTLLAVWKSILDPFRLLLSGGNLIFYPSLIIFAAALVLYAFRDSARVTA